MTEIALGSRIGAIGADPGLGDVQIYLHDPPLPPKVLDQEGEIGLDPFAGVAAALPQEDILGGLLADGRTAADTAARGIALHRILDRLDVEAIVLAEFAVLGANR